jgi:hypothetical protein
MVFIRMDCYLKGRDLDDYLYDYQGLKRVERIKKEKEEERINRFYSKLAHGGNKNQGEDDDFDLTKAQYKYRPSFEETAESFEINKNNREKYPTLAVERKQSEGAPNEFPSMNSLVPVNEQIRKIKEMEDRKAQERLQKTKKVDEEEECDVDEEVAEPKMQITIIKKAAKKKKGKK